MRGGVTYRIENIADHTRASTAATARISSPAPLDPHPKATCRLNLVTIHPLHAKSGQTQNPRTIAARSHASSLVGSTTRENDTGWSGAKWDRFSTSRPPSRPPTPSAVRAGGRVLPQIAVLKSVNSQNMRHVTMNSGKSTRRSTHRGSRCRSAPIIDARRRRRRGRGDTPACADRRSLLLGHPMRSSFGRSTPDSPHCQICGRVLGGSLTRASMSLAQGRRAPARRSASADKNSGLTHTNCSPTSRCTSPGEAAPLRVSQSDCMKAWPSDESPDQLLLRESIQV